MKENHCNFLVLSSGSKIGGCTHGVNKRISIVFIVVEIAL